MQMGYCKKCGYQNGWIKRTCAMCGAFIEGPAVNNVTGNMGHRHADGSFVSSSESIFSAMPDYLKDEIANMQVHHWPVEQQSYEELQQLNSEQAEELLSYVRGVTGGKNDTPLPK
jgi:hypothetical protein